MKTERLCGKKGLFEFSNVQGYGIYGLITVDCNGERRCFCFMKDSPERINTDELVSMLEDCDETVELEACGDRVVNLTLFVTGNAKTFNLTLPEKAVRRDELGSVSGRLLSRAVGKYEEEDAKGTFAHLVVLTDRGLEAFIISPVEMKTEEFEIHMGRLPVGKTIDLTVLGYQVLNVISRYFNFIP